MARQTKFETEKEKIRRAIGLSKNGEDVEHNLKVKNSEAYMQWAKIHNL